MTTRPGTTITPPPNNPSKFHFVFLCPNDRATDDNVGRTRAAIKQAAAHMQAFCRWQMGNNKTFSWDYAEYMTAHDSEWYRENFGDDHPPHNELYWANAQTDARDYAGARFYMPNDSWVIYVDAIIAPDQHAGGASVGGSGICVLHGKDCASIRGDDPDWTLCRGIGGHLHEALHTMGLPHPPPGPDFGRAVMGTGYTVYPNAILTEADKMTLNASRFFAVEPHRAIPPVCPFDDGSGRPQPHPRPHPLPHKRPVPLPHTIGDKRA